MQETKATREYELKHDALTNLPNRTVLQVCLQQAMAVGQREKKSVALLIMGLDSFREINQVLGYHIGDLLLRQVGSRVRDQLGNADTVARMGGVEFAVLLPSVETTKDVTLVASKILKAMEKPFVLGELKLEVQTSIGIALIPEHGTIANTLIQRANVALSVARDNHSGYAIYSPEQDQSNPYRLVLVGELRRALVEDQLFLLYQPKIDLQTGRIIGVESLVRWQHPKLGTIPPDQFVPLAERTGLIMPLTLWVLHEALRQCQAWNQVGLKIKMATNLSMLNLQAAELPDQVAGLLAASRVSPAQLELEITESAIMTDPARTMENLTRLSNMGLRISIDDFGTGYSSLAYLKKLPVNELKIDKSFVMNMATDKDDVVIVRATIDLGHHFGLKVVAEGVEDLKTKKMLSTFNCDLAQGYHISRPLPTVEITRWLRKYHNRITNVLR